MRFVQSNPDWNLMGFLCLVGLVVCLTAFLIYKGKL